MLKLLVIGNLGKDAVVNQFDGKSVINFSIAHTEKYKDKQGNQQQKTTWVECAYWANSVGIAPYLLKGTSVFVEGVPEINTFTKQDGSTGSSLKLKVVAVNLIGGGQRSNDNDQPQQQKAAPTTTSAGGSDDDLPF